MKTLDAAPLRLQQNAGLVLQRKCACGQHTIAGGQCDACRRTGAALQRSSTESGDLTEVPKIVHETLRGPGQPLDPATSALAESRFGRDFSGVRIHADANAAESARAVRSMAYTVGQHIAFAAGRYAPRSPGGQRLLMHELTHTVQQTGATGSPRRIGPAGDAFEREADTVADQAYPGAEVRSARAAGGLLQREPDMAAAEAEEDKIQDLGEVEDGDEVHDGDTPVSASSAPPEETVADSADTGEVVQEDGGTEAVALKGKGGGKAPARKKPAGPTSPGGKIARIDVDLSGQQLTVTWENGFKEPAHRISSGRGRPNTKDDPCKSQTEENCTPAGNFKVGSIGDGKTANSEGDAMSWYVGFVDSRGIGIHDSQPVPGVPHSHGCVRVGNTAADDAFAKHINQNVKAGVTEVNVSGKAPTKPWTKAVKKPKKKK